MNNKFTNTCYNITVIAKTEGMVCIYSVSGLRFGCSSI